MSTPTQTRVEARRAADTAPSVQMPPPPAKTTKLSRRPAIYGLGAALIALGGLTSYYLVTTLGDTVQVVAVAGPVSRGDVIAAEDLTAVDLPAGPTTLSTVPADEIGSLIGQRAAVDLLPGSILTPAGVVDVLTPPTGESIVGVALASYQMPTETLHAGDQVRIVETPVNQGEPPVEEPRAIEAVVVSVEPSAQNVDQTIVNVQVDKSDAAGLAARSATGRVALVLDSLEN